MLLKNIMFVKWRNTAHRTIQLHTCIAL